MKKLFLAFFYAFCGLLLGLCVSLIISTNVWLEMRIHEKTVIAVCVGLGVILSFWKNNASASLFFFSQSTLLLFALWLSKTDLIYYSIRNCYLDGVSISMIKILFLSLLSTVNLMIFVHLYGVKLTCFSKNL